MSGASYNRGARGVNGFRRVVSARLRRLYSAAHVGGGDTRLKWSLEGAKTFALWPLSRAAQSCFGTDTWPTDIPVPQAWLEFDVEDVEEATTALEAQGHRVLVKNKKERWGQTVSRFLGPEGLLIGITLTPSFRPQ